MKKITYLLKLFLLIAVPLFTACEPSVTDETEPDGFVIRLSLPPALTVDATRAATPPVLSGIMINNAWVVQFKPDGTLLHAACFTSDVMEIIKAGFTIKVTTSGFSNLNSRFRVIVNAGTDFLSGFSGNESTLLGKTAGFVVAASENGILVSDAIEFTPESGGLNDKIQAVVVAPLNRTYAKVDVAWTDAVASPASITIDSINAHNIPLQAALYTRGNTSAKVYPAAAAENFKTETYVVAYSGNGTVTNSYYSFYMPENLRGRGCGTSFEHKNDPAYGPKSDGTPPTLGANGKPEGGGSLDYCMYIDIVGKYRYNASASPITVRYRVYLGDNLIENYNVQRGYYYILNVKISGANSADVRVTITDGNVVVFDKVETIDKTVDFR